MTISIIIPTVTGREECLNRCVTTYRQTCPDTEIIIIANSEACGIAWAEGAAQATGDYLHFTADDLYPIDGWWQEATLAADNGNIVAARVNMDTPTGPLLECAVPLGGAVFPPNVLVPFFSRAQFEMGGWIAPIHYGSDDWVTFLAMKRELPIKKLHSYAFVHTADMVGRLHDNRRIDVPKLCHMMQREWFLPEPYEDIAYQLDPSFQRLLL